LFGNNDIIIAGKSFSFAEEIILKAFIWKEDWLSNKTRFLLKIISISLQFSDIRDTIRPDKILHLFVNKPKGYPRF
jgi:hypothetical protein